MPLQVARTVDVNLGTAEVVREILERTAIPVSRNWILKKLAERGHTTTRQRLNRVLAFFFGLGLAIEGSKGVQWTHNLSPSLQRALATGRRL